MSEDGVENKRHLAWLVLLLAVMRCAPAAPSPRPSWASPVSITQTGTIAEAGGGPIAGASVQFEIPMEEPWTGITDDDGRYELRRLPTEPGLIRVTKEGYEPFVWWITPVHERRQDFFMQRVIRINVGDSLDGLIYADDPDWLRGDRPENVTGACRRCRLLRIGAPMPGLVSARVTLFGGDSALALIGRDLRSLTGVFADLDMSVEVSYRVAAPGPDVLLLFQRSVASREPQPFRVETIFEPAR
jgi:hypothetical protein